MPTAAATLRRPEASTAGRYRVERRALRRESVPTTKPWCRTQTVSAPGADDEVERVAGAFDVVRVDGCRPPARQIAQAGVGQGGAEPGGGDDSQDGGDVQVAGRRVRDDDAVPLGRGQQSRGIRHGRLRRAGRAGCPSAPAGL